MKDNPGHDNTVAPVKRLLVSIIYGLGTIAGLMVGAYGIFIFVVAVIVYPSFYMVGLIYGLPLILGSIIYLAFIFSIVFIGRFRSAKYRLGGWLPALLSLVGLSLLAYYVVVSLLGF